jgi:hypothetical protein
MAATPEGKVKDKIKKLLKTHGAYYTMPVMTGMATNGTPDFSIGHAGRYLAIEAKAGDGAPTELQWVRLREVERAGCSTMVINEHNLHLVEAWLQDTTMSVHAVRELDSKRVLHHWTNKGVM